MVWGPRTVVKRWLRVHQGNDRPDLARYFGFASFYDYSRYIMLKRQVLH